MKLEFDGGQIAGAAVVTSGANMMVQTQQWWMGFVLVCVGLFLPGIKIRRGRGKQPRREP